MESNLAVSLVQEYRTPPQGCVSSLLPAVYKQACDSILRSYRNSVCLYKREGRDAALVGGQNQMLNVNETEGRSLI